MHRVHLVIHGRVQRVGFRYFVLRRAQDLGLHGWVRNRADGAVELEAEGERNDLGRLLQALRAGPPAAQVVGVDVAWSESPPRHSRFLIRSDPSEP